MESNIEKQFDDISEYYDSQRKKLIPCFDDFYATATLFATTKMDNPKILDLGAGTGLFSSFILNKYPKARLTLLDVSDKMLEVAKRRFSGFKNVTYIVSDYAESNIAEKYDLIISALSIHHLEDDSKVKLYKNIYESLNPEGVFVSADQCLPESSEYIDIFNTHWYNYVRSYDFSQEEIDNFEQRRKLDKESKLIDQISRIEYAGFGAVECVYKYMQFCVVVARK